MSKWKDYQNKSVLTLVYGYISAEVDLLEPSVNGSSEVWGIRTHPYKAWEQASTLKEAKTAAENALGQMLALALKNLPDVA